MCMCYLIIYVKKDFRLLNVITYIHAYTYTESPIFMQNTEKLLTLTKQKGMNMNIV